MRAQGYFNAWPEIVRTPEEIAAGEPMPLRLRATPDAISRMEQALRWITWVDVEERRLIWHRAARRRWKTICWELGCDRSTAWRKWNVALAKIAARLNAGEVKCCNTLVFDTCNIFAILKSIIGSSAGNALVPIK